MKLVISPRAERQIDRCDAWWVRNRPASPNLFLEELSEALALLLASPRIGRPYAHPRQRGLRRALMRATRYHIVYRIREDELQVVAVWSALRGRPPPI